MLVIADARETKQSGSALFPEFLKAELHGIRATIEAYSKKGHRSGDFEDALACGPRPRQAGEERDAVGVERAVRGAG